MFSNLWTQAASAFGSKVAQSAKQNGGLSDFLTKVKETIQTTADKVRNFFRKDDAEQKTDTPVVEAQRVGEEPATDAKSGLTEEQLQVRDNMREMLEYREIQLRAYADERDDYQRRLDEIAAAESNGMPSREAEIARNTLRDEHLGKADGTYYESFEDKYVLSDAYSSLTKDDIVEAVNAKREYIWSDEFKGDAMDKALIESWDKSIYDLEEQELSEATLAISSEYRDNAEEQTRQAIEEFEKIHGPLPEVEPQRTGEPVQGEADRKIPTDKEWNEAFKEMMTITRAYRDEARDIDRYKLLNSLNSTSETLDDDIKEKFLKKDDGTYYNSLEEKYGFDELKEGENSLSNANTAMIALAAKALALEWGIEDKNSPESLDFYDKMQEQIAHYHTDIAHDIEQPSNSAPNARPMQEEPQRTGEAKSDLTKDDYLKMLDDYKNYTDAYLDDKAAYQTEMAALEARKQELESSNDGILHYDFMEGLSTLDDWRKKAELAEIENKMQELKDQYLQKDDGTYYDSIEDKYGFDASFADKDSETLRKQFDSVDKQLRNAVARDDFDPNSPENRKIYDTVQGQMDSHTSSFADIWNKTYNPEPQMEPSRTGPGEPNDKIPVQPGTWPWPRPNDPDTLPWIHRPADPTEPNVIPDGPSIVTPSTLPDVPTLIPGINDTPKPVNITFEQLSDKSKTLDYIDAPDIKEPDIKKSDIKEPDYIDEPDIKEPDDSEDTVDYD